MVKFFRKEIFAEDVLQYLMTHSNGNMTCANSAQSYLQA